MSTSLPLNKQFAHEHTSITTFRLMTPTAELAIRDFGGRGNPVVLLHGGPGVPDYLEPVALLLASKYRVVTFDQRGVGKSIVRSGGYTIPNYLSDLEALREHLGVEKLHVFGHSWGGLLAQLYAVTYPAHVSSLFLASSSIGVGMDWKRMEGAVLRYNRRQAGWLRFLAMGGWTLLSLLPGKRGDYGQQRMFAQVWRNYFADPTTAPAPDPLWLEGIRGRAMQQTRQAILHENPKILERASNLSTLPVLILFGAQDIYGDGAQVVFSRFPQARHVLLEGSGHLPWLQAPHSFEQALRSFYDQVMISSTRSEP